MFWQTVFATVIASSLALAEQAEPRLVKFDCDQAAISGSVLQTAFGNLSGLPVVKHALDKLQSSQKEAIEFCVTGVSLRHNAYGYHKLLVLVDPRVQGQKLLAQPLPFVYLDSSTQGHNTFEGKPWPGLRISEVRELFKTLNQSVDAVYTYKLEGASPVEFLSGKFLTELLPKALKKSNPFSGGQLHIDTESVTVAPLPFLSLGGKEYAVLGWSEPLRIPDMANTLHSFYMAEIDKTQDTVYLRRYMAVGDVLTPLEEMTAKAEKELAAKTTDIHHSDQISSDFLLSISEQ